MKRNKLSLYFFIMYTEKKGKKIKLQWRNQSYCFVGGFVALFCWCIRELRKWLKKDTTVNTQDKTGEPRWTRQNTATYNYDIIEKGVYNLFQKKPSPKVTLQKRLCVPIAYLMPPNKIKPSKKCLKKQKSAHPCTTPMCFPLFDF